MYTDINIQVQTAIKQTQIHSEDTDIMKRKQIKILTIEIRLQIIQKAVHINMTHVKKGKPIIVQNKQINVENKQFRIIQDKQNKHNNVQCMCKY